MPVFNPARLLKYPKQYPFSRNTCTKFAFFQPLKKSILQQAKKKFT